MAKLVCVLNSEDVLVFSFLVIESKLSLLLHKLSLLPSLGQEMSSSLLATK